MVITRITILLIFWFTTLATFAQDTWMIQVKLQKVCVTESLPSFETTKKVLIYTDGKFFGLYTGYDTLSLSEQPSYGNIVKYIDRIPGHNNQVYTMYKERNSRGFIIILTPIKPYRRSRLWSIIISTYERNREMGEELHQTRE